MMPVAPGHSAFFLRVLLVIVFRSNEKVSWVYAWRVIAFVADNQLLWNISAK
jgi:hypothetical protein